jgi:hypothetical protein
METRNPEPESLAESLAGDDGVCPIPLTHDRLEEVHYWWHEMARNYHETLRTENLKVKGEMNIACS